VTRPTEIRQFLQPFNAATQGASVKVAFRAGHHRVSRAHPNVSSPVFILQLTEVLGAALLYVPTGPLIYRKYEYATQTVHIASCGLPVRQTQVRGAVVRNIPVLETFEFSYSVLI
jgi:hypothetical protein